MSACHCCQLAREFNATEEPVRKPVLFNRVTALLLTSWVGIVAVAVELAGAEQVRSLPSVELFIRSLVGS